MTDDEWPPKRVGIIVSPNIKDLLYFFKWGPLMNCMQE